MKTTSAQAMSHKECIKLLGEAMQDTADMAAERDTLRIAAQAGVDALKHMWGDFGVLSPSAYLIDQYEDAITQLQAAMKEQQA